MISAAGKRYNRETLEVHFKGLSIAEVLDLTVTQAREVFAAVPKIARVLDTLVAVGLGYLHLGQPATTLSGGEAQRIKLSRELAKRATGRTLYLLDEPTTGLHFDDVRKLLAVLHALVDRGNTVVVIEHNLDVIKTADWIIDLGPEGGDGGGEVVVAGTPDDVARCKASYTGQYLKEAPIAGNPRASPSPTRVRLRLRARTPAVSAWANNPKIRIASPRAVKSEIRNPKFFRATPVSSSPRRR